MIYCFDIDGTLFDTPGGDYYASKPKHERIAEVNRLYAEGHTIKLYTARGSETGADWREVTLAQLFGANVYYHELIMGKPHADIYVDDKGISDMEFFRVVDSKERFVKAVDLSNKEFA